ncbi:MAG: metal-sulfur cluster assembly factor [Verrucomicrobia bacterium]|nr:metal-sulfur cluster assembly factor [Verrucomicrobiota bacterium]
MTKTILNEATALETLRQVIDPEIGCNIVDLGLIYNVAITGGSVRVTMTLTTPGCPMGESIAAGVQHALLSLEGVTDAEVEVVWDPPWHPAMMTDLGRAATGVRIS